MRTWLSWAGRDPTVQGLLGRREFGFGDPPDDADLFVEQKPPRSDVQSGNAFARAQRLLPRDCQWSALVCPRDDISIRLHTLATGTDGTGTE
ncbi:hypothetical protein GCM10017557_44050 [Streptomyces aurantiacus]|uniref:Uncharacterized protein n=1 Tax=Streptomyces aurantiacus TaxID=47760 RepID=A0A7G1P6U9_9ACTN|nr:hypothetical protein GCM10017557_44050 [Streptomyces aurantiacus]